MKPITDTNPLGLVLATFREKKGISQKELGRLLGVNQRTVSSYEKGVITLSWNRLCELGAVLNFNEESLITEIQKVKCIGRKIRVDSN